MNCPQCNAEIDSTWFKDSYTVHCKNCNTVFNIKSKTSFIKIKEFNPQDVDLNIKLPHFENDELVICTDTRHANFLEYGAVKNSDHMHVRVQFKNYLLWMPKLVIEKVPKEWIE